MIETTDADVPSLRPQELVSVLEAENIKDRQSERELARLRVISGLAVIGLGLLMAHDKN